MAMRRMVAIWLALVNTLLGWPAVAAPERLLLSDQLVSLPGWDRAPDLTRAVYRPDLLRNGCPTIEEAAERLAAAVAATAPAPGWIRLDTIDLTAVGDCETCQPPPLDPHDFTDNRPTTALDERQFRFFAAAATALRGQEARPYAIVPAGTPLPLTSLPERLHLFLASPPLREAANPAGLAARAELEAAWREIAPLTYSLVTDGFGEFAGLPMTGDLLRRQWQAIEHPAVLVRDQATLEQVGPDWLAARLAEVAAAGATDPAGDPWRSDQPELARIVDVFAPLAGRYAGGEQPGAELVKRTLAAVATAEHWDRVRPNGRTELLAALTARHDARGQWEEEGLFSAAFHGFAASAADLKRISVAGGDAAVDGALDEQWEGATLLSLGQDDYGAPSSRPAEVRLMATPEALLVAVVATEPNPEEAGLHDGVVFDVAAASAMFPVRRLRITVAGDATLRIVERAGPPSAERSVRLGSVGVFDGPGWVLEAAVPWRLLGVSATDTYRLNVSTEHRRGSVHAVTTWQPTGGGRWNARRYGWVQART